MFYYLSFLRPPPVECAASATSIAVTPQIANDLRTELCPDEHDIMYTWLSPSRAPTPARKLTRWRASNAYRALDVPLPPALRPGDQLVLVLHVATSGAVCEFMKLDMPLPVRSSPIHIVQRPGQDRDKKQEIIERTFVLGGSIPPVRVREQTGYDLDKKMWDSGLGLSTWLVPLLQESIALEDELTRRVRDCLTRSECRVLELGTGTGFVSLMLYSALVATRPSSCAKILATDLPSALPLIQHNVAAVASKAPPEAHCTLTGDVLDWDDPSLPAFARDPDILIMADVTYNTAAFPSLLATLDRIRPPLLVLGYKERDPAERALWEMLRSQNIQLSKVFVVPGAGGAPVEVWVGASEIIV